MKKLSRYLCIVLMCLFSIILVACNETSSNSDKPQNNPDSNFSSGEPDSENSWKTVQIDKYNFSMYFSINTELVSSNSQLIYTFYTFLVHYRNGQSGTITTQSNPPEGAGGLITEYHLLSTLKQYNYQAAIRIYIMPKIEGLKCLENGSVSWRYWSSDFNHPACSLEIAQDGTATKTIQISTLRPTSNPLPLVYNGEIISANATIQIPI